MPNSEVSPADPPCAAETEQETAARDDKDYGCIFCITGREFAVAQRLERAIPGLKAISPVKLRYRRMAGAAQEERVILFPGYVFFEVRSDADIEIRNIYKDQDVIKILYVDEENKDWRLADPDRSLINLFFELNGTIGFSEAYFDEDDRIHIVKGFLKEHEGKIRRVNRRAKTVQITLLIGNKNITVWLGYEEISQ